MTDIALDTKTCKVCGLTKEWKDFPLVKTGNRRSTCKRCWSRREILRQKAERNADPIAWRDKQKALYQQKRFRKLRAYNLSKITAQDG